MLEATVAEVLQERPWVNLDDTPSWCSEQHIYCCVRPEAVLNHPIAAGARIILRGHVYVVCKVDTADVAPGELWWLIYVHPVWEEEVGMGEEEWHELYGTAE